MNALIIILTIVNAVILVLNYIVFKRTKTAGVDTRIHSLPLHTKNGEGVIIENKNKKPVVEFKKALR